MADKRIYELTTSTNRTGKFFIMDSPSQAAAHKFAADGLVDLASAETITGAKTFSALLTASGGISAPSATLNTITTTPAGQNLVLSPAGAGIIGTTAALGINNGSKLQLDGVTGAVYVQNVSGDMTFQDTNTGPHTLSDLVSVNFSFGAAYQVPHMNAAADDFQYTSEFTFQSSRLRVEELRINGQAAGNTGEMLTVETSGNVERVANIYWSSPQLYVNGNLTFRGGNRTLGALATDPSYSVTVRGGNNTGSSQGGKVNIRAGDGFQGGNVNIHAGNGASAGAVYIGSVATGGITFLNVDESNVGGTGYVMIKATGEARLYLRSSATSNDASIRFQQGTTSGTTVCMLGWDDSVSRLVLQHGGSFGTTGKFEISTTVAAFYGSSSGQLVVDGATSIAELALQANAGSDSAVRFRSDTSTQFIIGRDASASVFQIHSSSGFSSTADFQISTSGHIGLGQAPNSNDKLYVYDNNTSGTHYAIRIFHDGNNAQAARGIYIQCGNDTLTASDNTYLFCTDGNGTTVGTLLADTTSFRLFNAVSSAEFKNDIRELEETVVDKLKNAKAQPKRYKYKGRTKRERDEIAAEPGERPDEVGFIIEDLAEVFPDAVKDIVVEDGVTVKGYADTALIPYLVKAIKELSDEIETLKSN